VILTPPAIVSTATATAPQPAESAAVIETSASGVDPALAALVASTIADYLANDLKLPRVTTKDDVRRMITFEQQKQLLGCESAACEGTGNVGELLGVSRLVTSSLAAAGGRFAVSVTVLDARTGQAIGRRVGEVPSAAELTEKVRDLVHEAMRGEARASMGQARINVSAPGAMVMVDGALAGISPLLPVRLLKGRHAVRVERDGYLPFEGVIEVTAGREALLEVTLLAKRDVKVAGLELLPVASATGGIALALAAASGWFYYDAYTIYMRDYRADPLNTGRDGPVSLQQLKQAEDAVDMRGNKLGYYSAWGAGVLGGVSAALFAAYAIAGAGSAAPPPGAGGDAPYVEPRPDGIAIHF